MFIDTDGGGGWSSEGVSLVSVAPLGGDEYSAVCASSQLRAGGSTDFGVVVASVTEPDAFFYSPLTAIKLTQCLPNGIGGLLMATDVLHGKARR